MIEHDVLKVDLCVITSEAMSSGQQASSAVLCCSEEPRVFPPSAATDTKWRSTALSERVWHLDNVCVYEYSCVCV